MKNSTETHLIQPREELNHKENAELSWKELVMKQKQLWDHLDDYTT